MKFTEEELELAHYIAGGLTDVQISFKMGLAATTVRHQARDLRKRLSANNKAHLIHLMHLIGALP
jgi:DNA-binding NarL/FixJ family response regulator